MKNMNDVDYIIVQAGGLGSRLRPFTKNKPKPLVSVNGLPIIIKLFRQHPKSKFIIIADYKIDILKKYLKIFANVEYKIIKAKEKGSASGIKDALTYIPKNKKFFIVWCDLYLEKPINLDLFKSNSNFIGLSNTFSCRWEYRNNKFLEKNSKKHGVAGFYFLKNKNEIIDVPSGGEFCKYLKQKGITFNSFYLDGVAEIGTFKAYKKFTKKEFNTRPFNKMVIKNNKIIKEPTDKQGEEISALEKNWYKWASKQNFKFLPKIYNYSPLTMELINGDSLFKIILSREKKKDILIRIIKYIQNIHNSRFNIKNKININRNNKESILLKTKRRLDTVASLIPFIKNDFININGQKCINFYKKWEIVETLFNNFINCNDYHAIHGDITFSNIILDKKENIYFIDPRGYYGKSYIAGDPLYDWAKLYYSLNGNYDQFNAKNFDLEINKKDVNLIIKSNKWEFLSNLLIQEINVNKNKLEFYHAIIWLSLASYAWDDYDSICGAFYNGNFLMQKLYEKSF